MALFSNDPTLAQRSQKWVTFLLWSSSEVRNFADMIKLQQKEYQACICAETKRVSRVLEIRELVTSAS